VGAINLAAVVRQYEEMTAKNPADLEIARTLRFLYYLSGEDEKSLAALPGLTADEQKVWRGLMWTLISARDRIAGMSRADQAAAVLDALEDVRAALQRQAPLELGEIRFCERVKGFGSYEATPTSKFSVSRRYGYIRRSVTSSAKRGPTTCTGCSSASG